ncbi:MAG TPA: primosomal protein N' [Gammaproteobacteria bacterium]|nr:primosomal protein N' [Gammaproteobacteria bacterium]
MARNCILRVGVPSPLFRYFDYLAPAGMAADALTPGMRLRVPFGRRRVVGILAELADSSDLPPSKLRRAHVALDEAPLIPAELLAFGRWAADYYRHPPGEVLTGLLPKPLRDGRPAGSEHGWRLTPAGREATPDTRAPRQAALLRLIATAGSGGASATALAAAGEGWRAPLKRLAERGWIEELELAPRAAAPKGPAEPGPALNAAQQEAIEAILATLDGFQPFLLDGVTGSGKTEVYLAAVAATLAAGHQALVLAPEIALSPQLVERFERRLGTAVAAYHSGLADGERARVWQAARDGTAGVIIGTRSAIFLPLARPGLIVCDEEHDASYKQQDGFRYSARDLAVVRARRLNIPVVLGSATPSLETLNNARRGRYRRLRLPERTNATAHPPFRIVDMRRQPMQGGLSKRLLDAAATHLDAGGQVLLFLNRRGFAPVLRCHDCGAVADCRRCDARMTVHQRRGRLVCHHCGAERPAPAQCESCGSPAIAPLGQGTERLEDTLRKHFPDIGIVRIDRDSTRRKGAMESLLDDVKSGRGNILIGTQMVAKGHDFPNLTLVGIVDADQGLYGVDFRAPERMAQLIVQVAGRAGRADKPGEVVIQTHHPDHPLLAQIAGGDYGRFATAALTERKAAGLPPFTYMALIRAEAATAEAPQRFLRAVASLAGDGRSDGIERLGPASAPMLRRQGRYRFQLLLQAGSRNALHALLTALTPQIEMLPDARRVRWSIDVDPIELF